MNRPIYICTPVDEDKKESKERAHRAARYFRLSGTAISPVLALSYLDENDWLYKPLSLELIDMCKAMCVFADEVTEHMIAEIKRAKELGIPIKFYDADSNEIDYDALVINKRIGPGYRKMIMDAHGDTCGNGLCPYSGAPCAKGDALVASEQVPAEQHTADAVTPEETSIITKLLGWLFKASRTDE